MAYLTNKVSDVAQWVNELRTFLSTLAHLPRSEHDLSCTGAQCHAPTDRPDSDQWASSKSKVKLQRKLETWHPHNKPQQTLRNRQCWRPLVSQNIQTDGPIRIDVRVVDLCRKANFGWLERVVRWKCDRKEEDTSRIRWVTLISSQVGISDGSGKDSKTYRPHDCGLPIEHVIASGTSTTRWRWITSEIGQLLVIADVRSACKRSAWVRKHGCGELTCLPCWYASVPWLWVVRMNTGIPNFTTRGISHNHHTIIIGGEGKERK